MVKEKVRGGVSLVLRGEEEDGPVLSGLAPVGPVHLQHLLDAEAQALHTHAHAHTHISRVEHKR